MTGLLNAGRGFGRRFARAKKILAPLSGLASVASVGAVVYKLYEPKPADISRSVTVQSMWTYSLVDLIALSSFLFYVIGLLLVAWALFSIPNAVDRNNRRLGSIVLYVAFLVVCVGVGCASTRLLFYRAAMDYGKARAYFFDQTLPKAELSNFLFRAQRELAGGDLDRAKSYFDQALAKFGDNADIRASRALVSAEIVYAEKMHAWAEAIRKRGPHLRRELELETEAISILPVRAPFRMALEQTLAEIEEARAQWPTIADFCSEQNWGEAAKLIEKYGWYFLEQSQAGIFRNNKLGRRMLMDTCMTADADRDGVLATRANASITVEDVSVHTSLLSRADARWNYAAAKEMVKEAQADNLEAAKDQFVTSANRKLEASRTTNVRFVFGVLLSRMRVVDVMGLQRQQATHTTDSHPAEQTQAAARPVTDVVTPAPGPSPVVVEPAPRAAPEVADDGQPAVATVDIGADGVPVVSPPAAPVRVRPVNPGGLQINSVKDDGFSGALAPAPERPR